MSISRSTFYIVSVGVFSVGIPFVYDPEYGVDPVFVRPKDLNRISSNTKQMVLKAQAYIQTKLVELVSVQDDYGDASLCIKPKYSTQRRCYLCWLRSECNHCNCAK